MPFDLDVRDSDWRRYAGTSVPGTGQTGAYPAFVSDGRNSEGQNHDRERLKEPDCRGDVAQTAR